MFNGDCLYVGLLLSGLLWFNFGVIRLSWLSGKKVELLFCYIIKFNRYVCGVWRGNCFMVGFIFNVDLIFLLIYKRNRWGK